MHESRKAFAGKALRGMTLAGLLTAVAASPVRGQLAPFEPIGEGLTFGRFVLHPSMVFEYTEDSNIFFAPSVLTAGQTTSSGIISAGPRILVDLPLDESHIRVLYAPFYRTYTANGISGFDHLNHLFDMDTLFRAGRILSFRLRDHLIKGAVSLSTQNAGNGLSFGLGNYYSHTPSLEIGVDLGLRHGFAFIPSYAKSTFTQPGLTAFSRSIDYGFDTRRLEGRYNYKFSEPTTFYGYSTAEHTLQTQTRRDDVTIQTRSFGLGLARTLNERVMTQVAVGYTTMSFDGDTGGQDFSGPTADASVNLSLDDATRLEFAFLRHPYASVIFSTNYYVDTEMKARLMRQLRLSSYWDAGVRLIDNAYAPAGGVARRDGAVSLEGGIGHQFLRNLRGYVGGEFEYHQSNVQENIGGQTIDPYNYHVFRILFRLEVGWL